MFFSKESTKYWWVFIKFKQNNKDTHTKKSFNNNDWRADQVFCYYGCLDKAKNTSPPTIRCRTLKLGPIKSAQYTMLINPKSRADDYTLTLKHSKQKTN